MKRRTANKACITCKFPLTFFLEKFIIKVWKPDGCHKITIILYEGELTLSNDIVSHLVTADGSLSLLLHVSIDRECKA